jgi:hypothetical protein
MTTRYGIVFQKAGDRLAYGSRQAFGHDGAGGRIGIADPWRGIAYAWLPRGCRSPAVRTPGASAWPGSCASAPQPLSRARLATIVEAFQCVETKHAQDVRNFRILKSFHAKPQAPTRHPSHVRHIGQVRGCGGRRISGIGS